MNEDIFAAHKRWRDAHNAWLAEANRLFGMCASDRQRKGDPGTELRRLYDEVEAARAKYDRLTDTVD